MIEQLLQTNEELRIQIAQQRALNNGIGAPSILVSPPALREMLP